MKILKNLLFLYFNVVDYVKGKIIILKGIIITGKIIIFNY